MGDHEANAIVRMPRDCIFGALAFWYARSEARVPDTPVPKLAGIVECLARFKALSLCEIDDPDTWRAVTILAEAGLLRPTSDGCMCQIPSSIHQLAAAEAAGSA